MYEMFVGKSLETLTTGGDYCGSSLYSLDNKKPSGEYKS